MPIKQDFVRRLNLAIIIAFIIFIVFSGVYFYMAVRTQYNALNVIVLSIKGSIEKGLWNTLNMQVSGFYFLFIAQLVTFLVALISLLFVFNFTARKYLVEKKDALIDHLTQLYNRKAVLFALKKELRKTERFNHPTSVAMIDLDYFKVYNDKNGHVAGDRLLKRFANILSNNVREFDTPGRYGGEEFIIIFPETSAEEASHVCERIREMVEDTQFYGQHKMPFKKITCSIGIAEVKARKMRKETLIHKADELLYKAKNTGRNQVIAQE